MFLLMLQDSNSLMSSSIAERNSALIIAELIVELGAQRNTPNWISLLFWTRFNFNSLPTSFYKTLPRTICKEWSSLVVDKKLKHKQK